MAAVTTGDFKMWAPAYSIDPPTKNAWSGLGLKDAGYARGRTFWVTIS